MRGHGSCAVCSCAIGSDLHALEECDGVQVEISRVRWEGRLQGREVDVTLDGLQPLRHFAIPPRAVGWEPIELDFREGHLSMGKGGWTFGDGSGYRQQGKETRIATWSVVRLNHDQNGTTVSERMRGLIDGWFQTVPRAELKALIEHLRHAGPDECYGGDCQMVIAGAQYGVAQKLCTSANVNADLWREVRRLQHDHGTVPRVCKIRAHTSWQEAQSLGPEAVHLWRGNHEADLHAKDLARKYATYEDNLDRIQRARASHIRVLERLAVATAWNLRAKTGLLGAKVKRPRRRTTAAPNGNHTIVNKEGGGWECVDCRGHALGRIGLRLLKQKTCPGNARSTAHETHDIVEEHGIAWCRACGRYTTRWARDLRWRCPGAPQSEAQRNVKRRLLQGLPPTTAAYLQETEGDWRKREQKRRQRSGLHAAEGEAGRTGGTTASGNGGGIGRYLRLAGGPLHREAPGPVQHGDPSQTAVRAAEGTQSHDRHWCRPTPASSWSQRLSLCGAAGLMPCSGCQKPAAGRCRGCGESICVQCARARRPCHAARTESEPVQISNKEQHDGSPFHPRDRSPSHPRCHSLQPRRADVQARALGQDRPATDGEDFCFEHHHHHHVHLDVGAAEKADTPAAVPRRRLRGKQSFKVGPHPVDHHHHGSAGSGLAVSPSDTSHLPALVPASGDRHYRPVHQDGPGANLPEGSHINQAAATFISDHSSGQSTLHEEEAKQYSVVVAAPLTCSVSPLPQGLVGRVVVAALAADLSRENGPPQQRSNLGLNSVVEDLRVGLSPISSASAAAAPSSYHGAQS